MEALGTTAIEWAVVPYGRSFSLPFSMARLTATRSSGVSKSSVGESGDRVQGRCTRRYKCSKTPRC